MEFALLQRKNVNPFKLTLVPPIVPVLHPKSADLMVRGNQMKRDVKLSAVITCMNQNLRIAPVHKILLAQQRVNVNQIMIAL